MINIRQIRWGLENDIDASIYANPVFNIDQMEEIREGLKEGLDASVYANPELSNEQMAKIRLELKSKEQENSYLEKFTEPSDVEEINESSEFLDYVDSVVEKTKQEQQTLLEKRIKSIITQEEEH